MAVWPGTLPQSLNLEGFESQLASNVVRTPMDVGPAKQRLRSTAAPQPLRGKIIFNIEEFALFEEFFISTLSGGALEFEWVHPITRQFCIMRFTEPPKYGAITPINITVSMALEILP
jgi:hypothetical protein